MKTFSRVILYGFLFLLLVLWALPSWRAWSVLPLGWLRFLERNTPRVTAAPGMIWSGIVFSAAVVALGHRVASMFYFQLQTRRGASDPRWRWRWSFCAGAAIWVLFAISIGTAGVYYQTTWLMQTRRWYQERVNPYYEFKLLNNEIDQVVVRENGNLERIRKEVASVIRPRGSWIGAELLADEVQVLYFGRKTSEIEQVEAYVLVPRRPRLLSKREFGIVENRGLRLEPLTNLLQTIAQLESKYPSK